MVLVSQGKEERLIFYKEGNVVVTESGSSRGRIVTSYGDKGQRRESGAAIFGGTPADPGLPVLPADLTAGTVPKPDGGTLPPATALNI